MKAFVFDKTGEPSEVLKLQEVDKPAPGRGEVLVRVLLVPVHPMDLHVIRGRFGRQPSLPATPGAECVGVIEALGAGVTEVKLGARVILINVWGTWKDFLISPVDRVVVIPDAVSDEAAAQVIVNPVTAWMLTKVEHGLKAGQWLTQTAAGSTVGRLVLQLAKAEGFHTINLVRRREQKPEIEALGGDVVLCTEDEDWAAQLSKLGTAKGPLFAIDCVAGRVGATLARNLAPGGRLLVYGALSSHRQTDPTAFELPVFTPRLIYSAATIQGWYLFHWLDHTPLTEIREVVKAVLARLESRVLTLPTATRYQPEEVELALKGAESSAREGKPLLEFSTR